MLGLVPHTLRASRREGAQGLTAARFVNHAPSARDILGVVWERRADAAFRRYAGRPSAPEIAAASRKGSRGAALASGVLRRMYGGATLQPSSKPGKLAPSPARLALPGLVQVRS